MIDATKVSNRYEAAGTGRRLKGWNPPSTGPNVSQTGNQTVLNRVRDLVRNEWSAAAIARLWGTSIIGTGIVPRPLTKNQSLKDALTKYWNAFAKDADADGACDFYGIENIAIKSLVVSGEVFIRMRYRRKNDGITVPLQIQLIESEQVPRFDADSWPGLAVRNVIRDGIELSPIGRRVAYWVYRYHPGDKPRSTFEVQDIVRVPVSDMLHLFEPERPGQLRGVSPLSSVVTRLRGVADFDDAVLERQRLANLFTLFVTKPLPSGYNDQLNGGPLSYGDYAEPIAGLEPGISQELLPGEDVKFSDPPDAGSNYESFMREQYKGVASSQGLPFELMSGDIKDVSDRTLRVVINEFRRLVEQKQWLIIIPRMLQPVREAWLDTCVLMGYVPQSQYEEASQVKWFTQGFPYIHPVQDVQAKVLEVVNRLTSRSSVISEKGEDPDEIVQSIADHDALERSAGIVVDPIPDPNADKAEQQAQMDADLTRAILAVLDEQPR